MRPHDSYRVAMYKLLSVVISSFALTAMSLPADAQTLLSYWNMDASSVNSKLPANDGVQSATVGAAFVNISAGFSGGIDPLIGGTLDNIVGSSPTNRAVGFFRVGAVYDDGAFEMNNFDFANYTDGEISFALRGENLFTWDTNLEVDYRLNNGSWIDFAENLTYNSGWDVATISFGSLLDGASDVDLRIRTQSWLSIAGYLDIDNIQVTALPEPASVLLLAAGGMLLVSRRRRG